MGCAARPLFLCYAYVVLAADGVVGFHTLVVGEVSQERPPDRICNGLARYSIPLMVMDRHPRAGCPCQE